MTEFRRESITRTCADGRVREYLVTVPSHPTGVVLAFHPYGFDPESVIDGEQIGDRVHRDLPGVAGPAAHLGLAVIAPRGVGRVQPGAGTLGHPAHIDAAVAAAQELADQLGGLRITSLGLSLGGQEALLAAGRHPDVVKAVCSVNPIADLSAWYSDIHGVPVQIMLDFGVPAQIEEEVGGTPTSHPALYSERSAFSYLDKLSRLPLKLVWSPMDTLIPLGGEHQAGLLARELHQIGGRVTESIVTHHPTANQEPGRYAHESFDVWSALGFLFSQSDTSSSPGSADD